MLDEQNRLYMAPDAYLAMDAASDAKYEYIDGWAYMLRQPSSEYDEKAWERGFPGSSVAHSLLITSLLSILYQAVDENEECWMFLGDIRTRISPRTYFYTDLSVVCGKQEEYSLTNPILSIEILSEFTEQRDREVKFELYKTVDSLREYVLVGSEYKAIEVYRRDNSWRKEIYREGDTVELRSIGARFAVEDVYEDIL